VAALVVLAGLGAATGAHAGTVLVDRGTDGAPGDNYADTSTMTRDGRYVAYTSQASNLTVTPTDGRAEMYLLDRTTGISELVSVAADGTAANDNANFGAISDDGNVVAFSSPADNLDPTNQCDPGEDRHGHSIDCYQIYVRNRSANTTVAVAKSWNGDPTDGTTGDVSDITADGRYVVFSSNATNLVPGDTNATSDVFVRDLVTESTTRVSVDANGVQGDRQSWEPVITGDGRFVAFSSAATNLAPGADTAGAAIVVDRVLGTVEARGTDGVHHGGTFEPSLSDDGRLLTYVTYNNMIPADTDPGYDLYLEDRTTGVRSLINTDADGVPGPTSDMAHLTADGAYVMFRSGTALRPGDPPGNHYYRRRVADGALDLVNVTDDGRMVATTSAILQRPISADGRFATYAAVDGTVDPSDTNGVSNIFVRDFGAPDDGASGTGSADTDGEADGATYLDPVETSVVGPVGSSVSIAEVSPTQGLPSGFVALGQQADVHVTPGGTVADPIVLTFRFDASLLPTGADAATVHLFRNGAEVPDCTGAPSAVPDPCVSDRSLAADGDALLTARSSSASAWNGAIVPPQDTTDPQIGVFPPGSGATYVQGSVVPAQYQCTDDFGPVGLTCVGDVPSGATIDTSTSGAHTFHVHAQDAAGNTADAAIDYTVITDEFVQIGHATVVEGDSTGARSATFSVTLNRPADHTVGVRWSAADGSATGGSDYTRKSGTLKFVPSARTGRTVTTKLVTIPITGDTEVEDDEYFTVSLGSVTGGYHLGSGSVAYGVIVDDDATTGLRVGVGDASVVEGDVAVTNPAKVWITLSAPVAGPSAVSVRLTPTELGATDGIDHKHFAARTVVFKPGQWRKAVTLSVLADTVADGGEQVQLVLSSPSGGLTIARSTGSFTIIDDD